MRYMRRVCEQKSASVIILIWKSISKQWVLSSTIFYYSLGVGFGSSLARFNVMSFFGIEIPSEMFLQVLTETSDIDTIHRGIRY